MPVDRVPAPVIAKPGAASAAEAAGARDTDPLAPTIAHGAVDSPGAPVRKSLKSAIAAAVACTRLHRLLLRDGSLVIAFHRVNDETAGDALTTGVHQFGRLCAFLASSYDVLPLSELVRRLECGEGVAGCVSITFDDGYRDNFEMARPILLRLGLPATFFLTTRFIGSDRTAWWDEGIYPRPGWMTWEHVRTLHSEGYELGGHTRSHVDLGRTSGVAAESEIVGCRTDIERNVGAAVRLFAYPYGREENLLEENRELIRSAGFRCCASCFGGTNRRGADPFRLRRVAVANWFATPERLMAAAALGRA